MTQINKTALALGLVGILILFSLYTFMSNRTNTQLDWYSPAFAFFVLGAGFLDGLHPCAFGVLLFFIALLFSIKRTRMQILSIGLAYIFGVFAAYALIGFGLLQMVQIVPAESFFFAKLGAVLIIALGLINLKDALTMGAACPTLPKPGRSAISRFQKTSTSLVALIAGFAVGLCALPCAGGLYLALITTLRFMGGASVGFLSAPPILIAYILLFNVAFVLPLLITLLVASDKSILDKIEEAEMKDARTVKLIAGLIMVALGLLILFGGILR